MRLRFLSVSNWLKTPADRDIISHWTLSTNEWNNQPVPGSAYSLAFAEDDNSDNSREPWMFLALGDTGDAAAAGPGVSPQDAVAQQMARDAALPDTKGTGKFVLHTGDVVYMTGEKRLYDRNFRQPYAPFLNSQSTVDNMVFRIPFLPVPGNHDYYDLGAWASWLGRVPLLGRGLRSIAHRFFSFSLPEGGSEMGRAYMEAFVDLRPNISRAAPMPYQCNERTRVPNRYYQFRYRNVDVFALDSNTLDAPPPNADAGAVRRAAADRAVELQKRADAIDDKMRKAQQERERLQREARQRAAEEAGTHKLSELEQYAANLAALLSRLHEALTKAEQIAPPKGDATVDPGLVGSSVRAAEQRWTEGVQDLSQAQTPAEATHALELLEQASDDACNALRNLEGRLAALPQADPLRAELLGLRDEIDKGLTDWSDRVNPTPAELETLLSDLSEQALDVQRELVLEQRRQRYRPEDNDGVQLKWLDAALARSEQERPDAWRIVLLHHPPYTTIGNHSERPDVIGLRENLLPVLQNRAHLVLTGHSHAFEWFRSDAAPCTGFFVSGGGGQIALRPSFLDDRYFAKRRDKYDSLRRAGVTECATVGVGPVASDGQEGSVYHYLKIEVAPDKITVRPVGVRRLENGAFRREEPVPVLHARAFPDGTPPRSVRVLTGVEVYRDKPAQPIWSQG